MSDGFWPIYGGLELIERWRRLRLNYAQMQRSVDAGTDDWMRGDPYQIADWLSIFTPIESSAWQDLRYAGLPMWPQYPVSRFFLDFANPLIKVGLECDGADWHDAAKDARRDRWLAERGWRIFRAPGWRCNSAMELPDNWGELRPDERDAWQARKQEETLAGLLAEIRGCFGERLA